MRSIVVLAFAGLLISPSALRAQDNQAAGLFTEARQLPLVSQTISVRIAGGEAEVQLVQVFANDGADVGQADYHLYVPQGATVTGFGFWNGGSFFAAQLREKEEAEGRHRRAATEGRATALMKKESLVHSFSVYPVAAGELKKVQTTLRVTLERELGRTHVRLPVDAFLGQTGPSSTVLVDLLSEEKIADFGTEGGRARILARTDHGLQLGFSSTRPLDLWWAEQGPPLLTRVETVPLGEGDLGVQVRAVFNDAAGWRAPYKRIHLLVDASYSMRRRAGAIGALLDRVRGGSKAPVQVHLVAENATALPPEWTPERTVARIVDGRAGHRSHWHTFAEEVERLGCAAAAVRCAVVTDPQLEGLDEAGGASVPIVLLADVHELAYFAGRLPAQASAYVPGVDPEARLLALADQAVLPVLKLRSLLQEDQPLTLPGEQAVCVAEGGVLRLFARTAQRSPLTLLAEIDGHEVRRQMEPVPVDPATDVGAALRRGVYREVLAGWMGTYRATPDTELKRRIVELSTREGIPTAFTALQVDDPRLSLTSIKPGDPLLTVPEEPGLEEVVAWYPFGEMRRLVHDREAGLFRDRFLVPRGWREGAYRIEIFKHYATGEVRAAHVWYRLDEHGPDAQLSYDPGTGLVRIDTGRSTGAVAAVLVDAGDGRVLTLSPLGTHWAVPARDMPGRFAVVVRDRAGNRTVIRCRLDQRGLSVVGPRGRPTTPLDAHPAGLPVALPAVSTSGGDAPTLTGVSLLVMGRTLSVSLSGLHLRSLEVSAAVAEHDGYVIGTRGGDLMALRCAPEGACQVRVLTEALLPHPIAGLASMSDGSLLVGVLGHGLYELRAGVLRRSPVRVGSRFVTGVARTGAGLFVGTGYGGLWRIDGRRAVRTLFPHTHVAGLTTGPGGLEVSSGMGRYRLAGRDRFVPIEGDTAALEQGSRRLVAAAEWEGRVYVGSFDRGLLRLEGGRLEEVPLELAPLERQSNALAVFRGALWLATEGGLLEVTGPAAAPRARRVLAEAVHGLDTGAEGLAVASSHGLYVIGADGAPREVDAQQGPAGHGFAAVAWWRGALYAGGMDGLYRYAAGGGASRAEGFAAGWVTALLASEGELLVGTYDEGVYGLRDRALRAVPGLEGQWVPPNGLFGGPDGLWVGGIGAPPVHVSASGATAVAVPAEDVYGFLRAEGRLVLLTSNGLLWLDAGGQRNGSRAVSAP